MNLRNFKINTSTFFSLKDKKLSVEKAYTEGVYSDTPANRKLGRVGMSYADWENKAGKREESEEKIDNISLYRLGKILNNSDIFPMSVKDHKTYFLVSLEESDFKDKKRLAKTKETLENLGAKVQVSSTTHFLKAFKEDIAVQEEDHDFFKVGDFDFNVNSRVLTHKDGKKISLTPKEAELLKVFASNPNQFVSKDGLLEKVWGESNYYNSRSMDVYMTKLREKLSGDKDINLITIHWKGFKLILPKSKSETVVNEQKTEESSKKEESKKKTENSTIFKKINDHFKFEDEEGSWFTNTPISLMMANDKEFGEIIDNFTNYKVTNQSGNYKNDGSRPTMLGCKVEYKVTPKDTKKGEKKSITINNKTTIKEILDKLGSKVD